MKQRASVSWDRWVEGFAEQYPRVCLLNEFQRDGQINQFLFPLSLLVAQIRRMKSCQSLDGHINSFSQSKLQIVYWWSLSCIKQFLKGFWNVWDMKKWKISAFEYGERSFRVKIFILLCAKQIWQQIY